MCEQQIKSGTALQIHPDLTEFSIGFIVFGFMNEKQVVINIKQEYIYVYFTTHEIHCSTLYMISNNFPAKRSFKKISRGDIAYYSLKQILHRRHTYFNEN